MRHVAAGGLYAERVNVAAIWSLDHAVEGAFGASVRWQVRVLAGCCSDIRSWTCQVHNQHAGSIQTGMCRHACNAAALAVHRGSPAVGYAAQACTGRCTQTPSTATRSAATWASRRTCEPPSNACSSSTRCGCPACVTSVACRGHASAHSTLGPAVPLKTVRRSQGGGCRPCREAVGCADTSLVLCVQVDTTWYGHVHQYSRTCPVFQVRCTS